jgi:hypothetical protein
VYKPGYRACLSHLAKVGVAGSNPVVRSRERAVLSEGGVSRIAILTEKGIVTVTDGYSDRSVTFVPPRS